MPITHKWNGTILTITSDSGSSSMDLKGEKGDDGARGAQGSKGARGGGALINDYTISKDEVWSSSGVMDRFAEAMSYEGNPITCKPIPNLPFDIITEFDVKQEGSGTPYPEGAGKNLWNNDNVILGASGYTKTETGFKFVRGSLTGGTYAYMKVNLQAGKTYTISATFDNYCMDMYIYQDRVYGTQLAFSKASGTITYTAAADYENAVIAFTVNSAQSDCEVSNIQLEIGASATAYEKYGASNIRPIIGMDAVSVVRCGKNLVNVGNASGRLTNGNFITKPLNYVAEPDTTYTLSLDITSNVEPFNLSIGVGDENGYRQDIAYKNKYTSGRIALTFTPAKDKLEKYNRLYIRVPRYDTATTCDYTVSNIQLEYGATATAYEPYNGDTYTMELGQTVYSGSVDWNRGVMVVDKAFVEFDGTETFVGYASGSSRLPMCKLTLTPKTYGKVYSNMLMGAYSYSEIVGKANTAAVNNGNIIIHLDGIQGNDNTIFTDLTNKLAALKAEGNPLQVCYELEEPQEIPLTPLIIRGVKGENILKTNADRMTLFGRVETMATIRDLQARIEALEEALKTLEEAMGGE